MSEIIRLHDGIRCHGIGCNAKDVCWRVQQPERPRSLWSMFETGIGLGESKCEQFISIPEVGNERI